MKKSILIVAMTLLSGCSVMSAIYDNADACQSRGRQNYQYPSYCGQGTYAQRTTVYTDGRNNIVGYGSRYPYRNN